MLFWDVLFCGGKDLKRLWCLVLQKTTVYDAWAKLGIKLDTLLQDSIDSGSDAGESRDGGSQLFDGE